MKLLTKDLNALKRTDLTYTQIGILLTRMLNDNLGNDKAILALMQNNSPIQKSDLITLHEKGLIAWSGYNAAKKLEHDEQNKISSTSERVLAFMSKMYNRKFSAGINNISTLLRSGYTEEQLKLVIANRWKEWADDDYMAKYLKPSTLFRKSNFEKYLEEAEYNGVGSNVVKADIIGFTPGDILKYEDIKRIEKDEVYVVRIKTIDGKFGEPTKLTGKTIIYNLKTSHTISEAIKNFKDNGTEMAPDKSSIKIMEFQKAL